MARTKALTELTVADLWKEVKDPSTLWGDLTPQARRTLKLLLQNRMHEELTAYLGAERYARRAGCGGVRNGVYRRQLITTWGTIPDLEIPRRRDGGFRPTVLPRYRRRRADVDRLIRSVFLAGVSTRRVGRTLAEILGDQVSASTVSTMTRTLDCAVYAWHRRPLADQYRYLVLDGLSLRVKTPDGTKRRQILVAYGLTRHGRRELIDYRLVRTESQGTWEAFLMNLAARGLLGRSLVLLTPTATAASMPPSTSSIRTSPARPAGSTSCATSPSASASATASALWPSPGASMRCGIAKRPSERCGCGCAPGSPSPPRPSWHLR